MTPQRHLADLLDYLHSGEPDITNRQRAMLLVAYLSPEPVKVKTMARVLNVAKPVITRGLNTLGTLGLIRRIRDQDDRRNVSAVITEAGVAFLIRAGLIPPENPSDLS